MVVYVLEIQYLAAGLALSGVQERMSLRAFCICPFIVLIEFLALETETDIDRHAHHAFFANSMTSNFPFS